MKREGRPRGMVRTLNILPEPLNPRPESRILNKVDGPLAAGLFVKVATKPTNHSKFTGKSDRHPSTKSKDKLKGSQKTRSIGDKLNYKVLSWTVMTDDRSDKIPVIGYSASGLLDDLHQNDYLQEYDYDSYYNYNYNYNYNYDYDKRPIIGYPASILLNDLHRIDYNNDKEEVELKIEEKSVVEIDDDIIVHGGVMDDSDDGYQGFYDISTVFTAVSNDDEGDDDGWYIVGGM